LNRINEKTSVEREHETRSNRYDNEMCCLAGTLVMVVVVVGNVGQVRVTILCYLSRRSNLKKCDTQSNGTVLCHTLCYIDTTYTPNLQKIITKVFTRELFVRTRVIYCHVIQYNRFLNTNSSVFVLYIFFTLINAIKTSVCFFLNYLLDNKLCDLNVL